VYSKLVVGPLKKCAFKRGVHVGGKIEYRADKASLLQAYYLAEKYCMNDFMNKLF
jgi:hypothetical protein